MKFLVTGGAGFIGSNIVEVLLKRGNTVRVLDNFSTGKRENLASFQNDIELIEGDIRSYHLVQKAVKGVEIILHQAALPSVPRSIYDPITTNEVNVTGTLNVLESAKESGVRRLVFASSSSVYGDNPQLPKQEDMTPNPISPYAVSKLSGEKYCSVFNRVYGLETIALRYFNVFGPRQDPESQYSAVIPKFINSIMRDVPPVIYGDGETSRDFTFVRNVVEANILAAESEKVECSVMNCACNQMISLNTLVSEINKYLGKDIKPVYRDFRKGDIKISCASIEKIGKYLGYKPLVDFPEGLKITVDSYMKDLTDTI
ncbi:MAG: SDR family oxidoreductase [Bacteroidota bacterium]